MVMTISLSSKSWTESSIKKSLNRDIQDLETPIRRKNYGYLSGEIQSSSGLIRVRVGTKEVRADYVRTYLPSAESANKKNGDVSFSYVVASRSAENPK